MPGQVVDQSTQREIEYENHHTRKSDRLELKGRSRKFKFHDPVRMISSNHDAEDLHLLCLFHKFNPSRTTHRYHSTKCSFVIRPHRTQTLIKNEGTSSGNLFCTAIPKRVRTMLAKSTAGQHWACWHRYRSSLRVTSSREQRCSYQLDRHRAGTPWGI